MWAKRSSPTRHSSDFRYFYVLPQACSDNQLRQNALGEGFIDQDQLEWFSSKREHNQHTKVQYQYTLKFKYKLLQLRFMF
jgi:hypothetical protein